MAISKALCYCARILPLGIPQFKAISPCDLSYDLSEDVTPITGA